MNILKQLFNEGFKPGTCSDLVEWILDDESAYELIEKKYSPRDGVYMSYCQLSYINEANTELRKPLSIEDFVRPEEPKMPNYTDSVEAFSDYVEGLDGSLSKEMMIESRHQQQEQGYSEAYEAWHNWEPLFEGWVDHSYHKDTFKTLRLGDLELRIRIDENQKWTHLFAPHNSAISVRPTREDFIRNCNRHGIDLTTSNNPTKIGNSEDKEKIKLS